MICQQMRTCDVLDDRVLNTVRSTPREIFVPDHYKNLAFAHTRICLPHEQVMMTPLEESTMLQALQIQASDKILEIGTGTGYVSCLLAKLGHHIVSLDIFPDFIATPKKNCKHSKSRIVH